MSKIRLDGISKTFEGEVIYANFDAEIRTGVITAVTGSSGCGKTTLLRMLAGLEKPDSGTISGLDGIRIALLFQEDRLLPWLSVEKNIQLVLRSFCGKREAVERTQEALNLAELEGYEGAFPGELSGGMRRRAALARALAYDGDLVLMDEPFTGMDDALKEKIVQKILPEFQKKKKTVLLVTHNLAEAAELAADELRLSGRPVHCELHRRR